MEGSASGAPRRPLPPSELKINLVFDGRDLRGECWAIKSCVGATDVDRDAVRSGLTTMRAIVKDGVPDIAATLGVKLTPAKHRKLRELLCAAVHQAFHAGQDCTSGIKTAMHSAQRSKPREGSDEKRKKILELLANTPGRNKTDKVLNLIVNQGDLDPPGYSEAEIRHAVWPQKKRPR